MYKAVLINQTNQLTLFLVSFYQPAFLGLSFGNDLTITEIHMLDVPFRGLGKSISQVDGKNCETSVYIDSNVSTDDDTILCQLNKCTN